MHCPAALAMSSRRFGTAIKMHPDNFIHEAPPHFSSTVVFAFLVGSTLNEWELEIRKEQNRNQLIGHVSAIFVHI